MPRIIFTVAEKVEMVRLYARGTSYQHICNYFAATYPDRPIPSKSGIRYIIKKFNETGNVDPHLLKVVQPKKRLSEEAKLNICLTVEEGLDKPLSQIAQELNVAKSTVHKVLRSYNYKPSKIQAQQLSEPHPKHRTISCKNKIDHSNAASGQNRQKSRTLVQKKPHCSVQSHTQYQKKTKCCGPSVGALSAMTPFSPFVHTRD